MRVCVCISVCECVCTHPTLQEHVLSEDNAKGMAAALEDGGDLNGLLLRAVKVCVCVYIYICMSVALERKVKTATP